MVKTITITDDAYRNLRSSKRQGESFSEVIQRLTARRSVRTLVGALSPRQGEALRRASREVRGEVEGRVRKTSRELTR